MENLSNEIWKDVEEFENNYQISNFGRLRSIARKINSSVQPCGFRINNPRIIVPQDNGKGYQQYYVKFNNIRVIQYSHRLVAKYFLDNPDDKLEVNHIDGNKSNNHVSNLEWNTKSENMQHAVLNNLCKIGEESRSAKLSEKTVLAIRRLFRINPNFNKSKIAKKLNVSDATIHKIINNQRWKHLI